MPRNPYKYFLVDAALLKHRITIQSLAVGVDEVGQPTEVWTDLGTFWGLYTALTGRELLDAKQIVAEASGLVTFLDIPVMPTESMRLLFGTRTLGIVNVNPNSAPPGARVQILCTVSEIKP